MKKQLNIDGVYFRVKRMGKYCNVCFSDLENSEMDEYLEDLVELLRPEGRRFLVHSPDHCQ